MKTTATATAASFATATAASFATRHLTAIPGSMNAAVQGQGLRRTSGQKQLKSDIGRINLQEAPLALSSGAPPPPPSLTQVLEEAEFEAAAATWFVEQDVADVPTAAELSLAELQQIFAGRATVGKVRRLHRILSMWQQALSTAHLDTLEPTPTSVFSRAMLKMEPLDLKAANLTRLTSETIFASLMLTIALAALIDTPRLTEQPCVAAFGASACERLLLAYATTFGIASAFFIGSCIVTLGAVNLFHNVATRETVHYVSVSSELYASLSFLFISLGLILGLLPGSCVNMFLRFSQSLPVCVGVTALHWLVWLWQVIRGMFAVQRIYGAVPGFATTGQFMAGLLGLAALRPVVVEAERTSLPAGAASIAV